MALLKNAAPKGGTQLFSPLLRLLENVSHLWDTELLVGTISFQDRLKIHKMPVTFLQDHKQWAQKGRGWVSKGNKVITQPAGVEKGHWLSSRKTCMFWCLWNILRFLTRTHCWDKIMPERVYDAEASPGFDCSRNTLWFLYICVKLVSPGTHEN